MSIFPSDPLDVGGGNTDDIHDVRHEGGTQIFGDFISDGDGRPLNAVATDWPDWPDELLCFDAKLPEHEGAWLETAQSYNKEFSEYIRSRLRVTAGIRVFRDVIQSD